MAWRLTITYMYIENRRKSANLAELMSCQDANLT